MGFANRSHATTGETEISEVKMKQRSIIRSAFFAAFCIALSATFGLSELKAQDALWRTVSQAEIDMKTPLVEPDADAEAIFWEIRIDDKKANKLTYSHYVRVKIFTERGRERFSKMDIPFIKGRKIEDVAARVVKPDGSIIELKPEDIFEREIAKAGKRRVSAKSFAVPGIEPGVIVEYRYNELIKDDNASGERLVFQRDIPMERVSYYVRPYGKMSLTFNSYNMPDTRFIDDRNGFRVGTMTNVPAYKDEPYMPPDDEVRKWTYLRYVTLGSLFQWNTLGGSWEFILKKLAKPNKEVKAKAEQLVAGAASDEEKIRNIYNFVQNSIKNVAYDRNLNEEQIEKLDVKDADDALKRGMGKSFHLDMLFAALARAAGFETNVVLAGDRSDNFFTPEKYPYANFISMAGIAVKVGNDWRYFDPCTPYIPFGFLRWNNQDVKSMLVGDGGSLWRNPPLSDYKQSPARRTGKFKLLADGTLEGEVRLEYDGHQAMSRRSEQYRDSENKREESIKDEIKAKLPAAEISALSIENFERGDKPLTYIMRVRVPNYAQRAGKRLILQPGFFEYGSQPVFSSATRTYDVYFPYPWSEEDNVEIKMPDGFAIDTADSPGEIADKSKIGSDKISMTVDTAQNTLKYKRDFYFGGNGKILFQVGMYSAVKGLFDAFNKADTHAISLKQQSP